MRTKEHITQMNYCLTLVRKAKKDYYNNLDHENVTDNKTFWKYIKPLFSEKSQTHNKITLVKLDLILVCMYVWMDGWMDGWMDFQMIINKKYQN